ncbi:MAG: hypothetical protein O3C63_00670 [Cyanobacteria bacterium]|nr:hypothetical protein [Cyanobacteriota bacterium]
MTSISRQDNTPHPDGNFGINTGQKTRRELTELQVRLQRSGDELEAKKVGEILAIIPDDVVISSPSKSPNELYHYFFQTYSHTMKNIATGVFSRMRALEKLGEGDEQINKDSLKEIYSDLKKYFDTLWAYTSNFAGHVCDSIPLE